MSHWFCISQFNKLISNLNYLHFVINLYWVSEWNNFLAVFSLQNIFLICFFFPSFISLLFLQSSQSTKEFLSNEISLCYLKLILMMSLECRLCWWSKTRCWLVFELHQKFHSQINLSNLIPWNLLLIYDNEFIVNLW